MRTLPLLPLIALAAAGAVVGTEAPAVAAPSLQYWYGTVTRVADGDTIYVDVAGDGVPAIPVRNASIQATEVHGGPGGGPECHAAEATAGMLKLVPPGTKVRLAAYDANSTAGTDGAGATRYYRYVDKWNSSTGRYDIDVQRELVQAGLVMDSFLTVEPARAAAYHLPMQQAMQRRIGLFDPDACGTGPAEGTPLQMWANYDADGADAQVANGEWLRIRNSSAGPLSLSGWTLRDAGHSFNRGSTYYPFPAGATIPAGGTITVYPGAGTTSVAAGRYYIGGRSTAAFPNVSDPTLGSPGKAVYLLDPQQDFRAWADYPCLTSCTRPPVHIAAVGYTTSQEYVDLRLDASATTPVDLTAVVVTNDGWTKELAPGTVLRPGETLRVWCERTGSDTRLEQFWGHDGGTMLEDRGDIVVLRTAQSVVLDTYRWGLG